MRSYQLQRHLAVHPPGPRGRFAANQAAPARGQFHHQRPPMKLTPATARLQAPWVIMIKPSNPL
jgi:hypothetical protein